MRDSHASIGCPEGQGFAVTFTLTRPFDGVGMEGIILMLALVVLAVPVLLIVALAMISSLKSRVSELEMQVGELSLAAAPVAPSRAPPAEPTLADLIREQDNSRTVSSVNHDAERESEPERVPPAAPQPVPPPLPTMASAPAPAPASQHAPASVPRPRTLYPPQPARPSAPSPFTVAARAVRRWFSEGNVPVKIGMLVLFAGVAALLKYASDQGWMVVPIELRLAGVAAAAVAGLWFGWRQREIRRSFGLSLQGGAIGVLLLVVFAAFKLYGLLPAGAAFALSIVLVACLGVLAVVQNAIALALLGILAGFLAPIWLSTGHGSHVALFSYYAVLNAAIFAIAWWRSWRALNVLGFVFTFAIGTAWGVLRYRPEYFDSTEPFLLLFFAMYLLIPILYARRRAAGRRDFLDACLVFGMPLAAFSLQAALLEGERMPLAYCALGLGVIYAALAWWLRQREHFERLVAPYAVLAVGFATLAVPLALSAQATAGVFALEGAALAWLGLRQHNRLQQWAGAGLQIAAAVAFAIGVDGAAVPQQMIANAPFMVALLIALAGFASAWSYRRAEILQVAALYYLWGLAWWLGNGLHEIDRFVAHDFEWDFVLMLVLVSGWLAAEVHRRLPSIALAWTAMLALLAALPLALVQDAAHVHPLAGYGWLAWLLFVVAGWRILHCLRDESDRVLGLAHGAWLLAAPLVLSLWAHASGERMHLSEGWLSAAVALPWLALMVGLQWRAQWLSGPLGARFQAWRGALQWLLVVVLAVGWFGGLWLAGDSAPLPWLPLLNPLGMVQVAALVLLAVWLQSSRESAVLSPQHGSLLAAAGFAMISVMTLRGCHHWGGTPWSDAMFSTNLVQTSLTVVWSLLGVLGWISGSRRGKRTLWLAGAVLMAVVLAKLLLVDRQHLGNLLGIISFIAYGLLCTVVGYFAPAPPKHDVGTLEPGEEAA